MQQFRHGPFNNNERTIIEDSIKQYVDENYDILFSTLGKRTRRTEPRPNYWSSTWGRMLRNPQLQDSSSKVSRKFRRRFRVPYVLFKDVIVPQCVAANVFDTKSNSTIPIEIKVLVALRILGRNAVSDDNELRKQSKELHFYN